MQYMKNAARHISKQRLLQPSATTTALKDAPEGIQDGNAQDAGPTRPGCAQREGSNEPRLAFSYV